MRPEDDVSPPERCMSKIRRYLLKACPLYFVHKRTEDDVSPPERCISKIRRYLLSACHEPKATHPRRSVAKQDEPVTPVSE